MFKKFTFSKVPWVCAGIYLQGFKEEKKPQSPRKRSALLGSVISYKYEPTVNKQRMLAKCRWLPTMSIMRAMAASFPQVAAELRLFLILCTNRDSTCQPPKHHAEKCGIRLAGSGTASPISCLVLLTEGGKTFLKKK
jgi:hypothetical protein